MAYVANNPTSAKNPEYFNVTKAVGVGASNRRDDVLLVQWMLHRIAIDTSLPWTPPDDDIATDGWFGPQTHAWIRSFQKMVKSRGNSCVVDGRVDHMNEGQPKSTISNTQYTILWMNIWLREDNPVIFHDPGSDPDIPQELLLALATNSPEHVVPG